MTLVAVTIYLLNCRIFRNFLFRKFEHTSIHQSEKSTVGQLSIEDVDNDGHPEMFVPAYNEGVVYIYRLIDN
jgi:hypothetical protein